MNAFKIDPCKDVNKANAFSVEFQSEGESHDKIMKNDSQDNPNNYDL